MCIVCNCGDDGNMFLIHFRNAQETIRIASASMKLCALRNNDKKIKRRYDRAHKKMVKLMREWNKIEHMRELGN
jgi:hypothetical protein